MSLSLIDAFSRFGAKPSGRLRCRSAMAADGAIVLSCPPAHIGRPARGVLRYEDRLSRDSAESRDAQLLSQHLTLARDGALPIRMVVLRIAEGDSGSHSSGFDVRPDLIGKVVAFDGDHFVVDFIKRGGMRSAAARGRS